MIPHATHATLKPLLQMCLNEGSGILTPDQKLSVWTLSKNPQTAAEGGCLFIQAQNRNPRTNILHVLITTWRKFRLQFSVNYSVSNIEVTKKQKPHLECLLENCNFSTKQLSMGFFKWKKESKCYLYMLTSYYTHL